MAALMKTPYTLPSVFPSSASAGTVSFWYVGRSRTSSSATSLPAWAYSAICPGPGSPARSGSTPEATPVVRTVLMSRVPVYLTFAPVRCSHGSTIFRNAVCSSPPQVPMTVTSLPLRLVSSPPSELLQPVAASATATSGISKRFNACSFPLTRPVASCGARMRRDGHRVRGQQGPRRRLAPADISTAVEMRM
jgi:hypothetical protein